jgi:hypothetical protein
MNANMTFVFSRLGLVTCSAMSPPQAGQMIRDYDISIVVIDVIHFHPRCIMDFLAVNPDLYIVAINCNFRDTRYYAAKEFGAHWATSPTIFLRNMPVFLKMLGASLRALGPGGA